MRTSAGSADGLDELIVPRGTKFCMASEPEPPMSFELILRANEETLLAARCMHDCGDKAGCCADHSLAAAHKAIADTPPANTR